MPSLPVTTQLKPRGSRNISPVSGTPLTRWIVRSLFYPQSHHCSCSSRVPVVHLVAWLSRGQEQSGCIPTYPCWWAWPSYRTKDRCRARAGLSSAAGKSLHGKDQARSDSSKNVCKQAQDNLSGLCARSTCSALEIFPGKWRDILPGTTLGKEITSKFMNNSRDGIKA